MTRKPIVHPGILIRECLDERDMTQADLARKAGLTQKHISRVVTGQAGVGIEASQAIAHALGIDASVLVRMQADWNLAHSKPR